MANEIHKAETNDGWHGVIEEGGQFPPEKGRYHLYIGHFCPFAHRVSLVHHIKGLSEFIGISVVAPYPKGENGKPGWRFPETDDEYPNATVDKLYGSKFLHEIYFKADKDYTGRYSVPVLWDQKTETIVNNESAEMLRWLPNAFNKHLPAASVQYDLYPGPLRAQIDECSEWLQSDLNTGVYKTGGAANQADYEKAVGRVFAALNKLEDMLAEKKGPFILGETMTELDIRTYTTVVRFDTAYVQLFLCNAGTIRHDYPHINNWLKNLYWNVKGFKETTDFKHIKEGYFNGHKSLHPRNVIPFGPLPDVEESYEPNWQKVSKGGVPI